MVLFFVVFYRIIVIYLIGAGEKENMPVINRAKSLKTNGGINGKKQK